MPYRNEGDIETTRRDFETDEVNRYLPNFVRTNTEGRSYEDLQGPDKLRLREIQRKIDDYERFIYNWEAFLRHATVAVFNSGNVNEDARVPHTLGVVPTDIILGVPYATGRDQVLVPGSDHIQIWKGETPWTNTTIFLRSSMALSIRVYLVE